MHGYNGLKYFLTIIAVLIRSAFELRKGIKLKVLALISSAIAALMNTYYDIMVDWGLLQRKSKNFGLRDKLLVSHKSVYFAAMVSTSYTLYEDGVVFSIYHLPILLIEIAFSGCECCAEVCLGAVGVRIASALLAGKGC